MYISICFIIYLSSLKIINNWFQKDSIYEKSSKAPMLSYALKYKKKKTITMQQDMLTNLIKLVRKFVVKIKISYDGSWDTFDIFLIIRNEKSRQKIRKYL